MIDIAQVQMGQAANIALEQVSGVNDNMSKSHYHEYFELYFLEYGERYHIIDDSIYKTLPGDFMLFTPLTLHRSYGDSDVSFSRVVIYFTPEKILYPDLNKVLLNSNGMYRPNKHTLHVMRQYIFEMLNEQSVPSQLHDNYIQTLLNMMLFEITRMNQVKQINDKTDRISRIIRYINSAYASEITLKDLAARFYVNEYYLCHEFKKYTNRSIGTYISNTRIINAQRLFMETKLNVTQVAQHTGFTNLSNFNRVFKKITGMTPSEYRKKIRDNPC